MKSHWFLLTLVLLCSGTFLDAQQSAAPRDFVFDSADGLTLIGIKAEPVTYQGRKALKIVEDPAQRGQDAIAIIKGTEFFNGAIELEMAGLPAPGARADVRGFVGLIFRAAPDGSQYENFYLRPTNGRAEEQIRRNHATQYTSFPDWPWSRLRQDNPGVYESYVDCESGVWTKLRVEVEGLKAKFFVNGAAQPALVVNDLKLGETQGAVGLWIGLGTEAYFSNLKIIPGPGTPPAATAKKVSMDTPATPGETHALTDADQFRLGGAMYSALAQARGIGYSVESNVVQAYMQGLVDRMATLLPNKPKYVVHFDPFPRLRGAFTLPGRHIVVGGGAIAVMGSEDELVALLLDQIARSEKGLVTDRLNKLIADKHLVFTDPKGWDPVDFAAPYTKEQDIACDREAAQLALKAGYSPRGLEHLLETYKSLATQQANFPAEMITRINDRLEALRAQAKTNNWGSFTPQKPLGVN